MSTNVRHVTADVVAALVVVALSLLALSGSAHAAGEMVDLSITKTARPEPVDVGADLTYTIVVKNAGPDATTSTVVDTLSPTVTYVSSTPNGECALQGTVLTCNVPNLTAGNQQTIKVVVQPQAPGPLVNVATVNGGPVIDTDPSNNVATAVSTVNGNPGSVADLQIVKTANPDPATVGEPLTYTLTVTNNGPDTVQSQVIDALPLTTTYDSSDPSGECSVQGNVANCAVPALAAGATHVIHIVVTPTAPAPVLNTATVNGGLTTLDTNPTNNISAIITMVNSASTPPPTSPSPSPTHSHPSHSPSGTPSGGIQTGAGGTSGRPLGPMVVGFVALLMLSGTLVLRLRGRGWLTR